MPDNTEVLMHLARFEGKVDAKMGAQDEKLEAILEQVKATNGRVTALERKEAVREGAAQAVLNNTKTVKWWVATLIAASGVAAAVTSVLVSILS